MVPADMDRYEKSVVTLCERMPEIPYGCQTEADERER